MIRLAFPTQRQLRCPECGSELPTRSQVPDPVEGVLCCTVLCATDYAAGRAY